MRASNAKNIVEFGTSFGVGTIYLASGAKDNGGHVISSELESHKCRIATANIEKTELPDYVTVLEGDALQTLKGAPDGIDLLFLDGWKDLYNDVLDLLLPKLRIGTVVIADNINLADAKTYMERVSTADSGFVTSLIGKETAMSCYVGKP